MGSRGGQTGNDFTSVDVSGDEAANNRAYSNTDPKIQKLKEHVNEVSNIMQENIDKILERGSRLDHLEDRSEMLSSRADEFRVSARRVSRRMWWQNMKINIIIAVIVIVVILIIVLSLTSN